MKCEEIWVGSWSVWWAQKYIFLIRYITKCLYAGRYNPYSRKNGVMKIEGQLMK